MNDAQRQSLEWLVGEQARHWLTDAAADNRGDVQLTASLRKQLSAEQTHLVLQQRELRQRARSKFSHAQRMFFTPLGLEQATDELVAQYVASRFPAAGDRPIVDLCCGIGGNLIALADRGPAIGLDTDLAATILAAANVRAICGEDAQVETIQADAAQFARAEIAAWHLDPDRRPAGKRTTLVALHQPGPEVIERWWRLCPHGAVKLAPAAILPEHWPSYLQLEWISRGRECRQLIVWSGHLAQQPGRRGATALHAGQPPRTFYGAPQAACPIAPSLGSYLFEPDPAVLAAGLQNALAEAYQLAAVQRAVAYFTGDRPLDDPLLAGFKIEEVLPYDIRRIASLIHARQIGQLEIKKRGLHLDPAALRRQLKPHGPHAATLLVFPAPSRTLAVLAHRC